MESNTVFTPGMLVAICETWPKPGRVILIDVVSTVGKRFIKTEHNHKAAMYRLNGTIAGEGVYKWRAIKPLTKALLAQAVKDGANCLDRAEGRELPDA